LAHLDESGALHFIGRIKEVIKTAGVNVAAAEVEATLQQHPDVKVAHVIGVPHPTRGGTVAAFRGPGTGQRSAELLMASCRERLATYKVPRHIFFLREDELPSLGSGKVNKHALRARAIEQIGKN